MMRMNKYSRPVAGNDHCGYASLVEIAWRWKGDGRDE